MQGLSPREFELWFMLRNNSHGVCAGCVDYYQVLGVDSNATTDDIKRAYKQSALRWHPDEFHAEQSEYATKRFQEISSAYEVLKDPIEKKEYDAKRDATSSAGQQPMTGQQVTLAKAWEIFIDFMVTAWVSQYQLTDRESIRQFISNSGIAEAMAMWGGSGTIALMVLAMAMLSKECVLDAYRDLKDEEKVAFFKAVSLISRRMNQ